MILGKHIPPFPAEAFLENCVMLGGLGSLLQALVTSALRKSYKTQAGESDVRKIDLEVYPRLGGGQWGMFQVLLILFKYAETQTIPN